VVYCCSSFIFKCKDIESLIKSNIHTIFEIIFLYICPKYFEMIDPIITGDFNKALEILTLFNRVENLNKIEEAGNLLVDGFSSGNTVFSCGNGGSMSDAMHFAEELTGRFRDDRRALPAVSISDPTHISCTANDYGFDCIFSRYLEAHGKPGDILLAISTSGNSGNVLLAAEYAKKTGMKVIALSGKDGGKLSSLADVEIRAPYSEFSDRTQEIHIKVIHALIHFIESKLFL
jgi:D-sedoheptulose 7-phosphate isomerase